MSIRFIASTLSKNEALRFYNEIDDAEWLQVAAVSSSSL